MISHTTRLIGAALGAILAAIVPTTTRAASAGESLAADPKPVEFFVSPKGNDAWSGRLAEPGDQDGPFATMTRARDAVRAWRRSQPEPQPQPRPVRVVLRGGIYPIDQPLEFGPEDSGAEGAPVIYEAAAGEKVIIS